MATAEASLYVPKDAVQEVDAIERDLQVSVEPLLKTDVPEFEMLAAKPTPMGAPSMQRVKKKAAWEGGLLDKVHKRLQMYRKALAQRDAKLRLFKKELVSDQRGYEHAQNARTAEKKRFLAEAHHLTSVERRAQLARQRAHEKRLEAKEKNEGEVHTLKQQRLAMAKRAAHYEREAKQDNAKKRAMERTEKVLVSEIKQQKSEDSKQFSQRNSKYSKLAGELRRFSPSKQGLEREREPKAESD